MTCSSSDITDYDSSSSIEFFVCPKKLKEEIEKDCEQERKDAAKTGEPTYDDGTKHKINKDGKVRDLKIVQRERVRKKHRKMKAECARHVVRYLQRPYVRNCYEASTRDPPEYQLWAEDYKKKIRVDADENRMSVMVIRTPITRYHC